MFGAATNVETDEPRTHPDQNIPTTTGYYTHTDSHTETETDTYTCL